MKIAVMGAGAVGCYYGGLLARSGRPVVLIGRPGHVAAMQSQGLRLETTTFDTQVAVGATTEARGVEGADIVLCCVKTDDTEAAAVAMRPWLAPGCIVVSLQNGIDNAQLLRRHLPQEVIAAAVYVAAEMAGNGHVKHHGAGRLVIGASPRSQAVADLFAEAGVPVDSVDNIAGVQWTKLIVNCAYNALSAITALPYAELVRRPGMLQVIDGVVAECLAVAEHAGITLHGDVRESVRRIPLTMATQTSSTAQDLQRGRRTEIDHLNGRLAALGEELGVPVAANRMLHALVKALEGGRR